MANCSTQNEIGSIKYALGAVGLLGLTLASSAVFFSSQPKTDDLEAKRGNRRVEIREKIAKEADSKILGVEKAEWVNKEGGTAKIPLSAAIDLVVAELRKKQPVPSAVKVDPIMTLGSDAPKMPSAPSGAATVRFPAITTPVPVKSSN